MNLSNCIPQKISKLFLASLMMAAAIALIIIGFTLLPVIGFILALPVIALSIYIFKLHLNDQCVIDPSMK